MRPEISFDLDSNIIEQCSPTLAGLKTANLFRVKLCDETDINASLCRLNRSLRKKGIRIVPLKRTQDYALIYLYRPDYLKRDLSDPKAILILENKGYSCKGAEYCIAQLMKHLQNDETFPHEIGLFLGYPPSDVECFMKSPRDGVECCGCWKVYSNKKKAENTFMKYKRCTEIYRALSQKGRSLAQLTVVTDSSLADSNHPCRSDKEN